MVKGKIEHRSVFGKRAKGYIEISVITPTGEIADKVSIRPSVWRSQNRHNKRVTRAASFTALIDKSQIEGATIRIGFHETSETGANKSQD